MNHIFTKPPVLIGGCGRSARLRTSILLSVLSAHPAIEAIPHETEAFCPTAWDSEPDLAAPFRPEIIDDYLAAHQTHAQAHRWLEKIAQERPVLRPNPGAFPGPGPADQPCPGRPGRGHLLSPHPAQRKALGEPGEVDHGRDRRSSL